MILEIILAIVVTLAATYFYVLQKLNYWKNANVPYSEPLLTKGNLEGVGSKKALFDVMTKYYQEFKEKAPLYGFYFFINPVAVATDISLVKSVLINDKSNFINRGIYYNENEDPLSAHLFTIENPKWKILRAKLTPTFTSGKMKMMFGTIVDVAHKFIETMDKETKNVGSYEIKDLLARFTTDVIGSCAFGLECNSLNDPNNDFRMAGIKTITVPLNLRLIFVQTFRSFAKKLKMKVIPEEVSSFFMNVVKETIKFRETNSVNRNDFMNLLIQMKNKGEVDSDTEPEKKIVTGKLTIEEIGAQAFVFFLAGFETSSSAMGYLLYELALNEEIQEKARENVLQVLKKHNGEFTYEAVMEMSYLDQCLYESLRKYPIVTDLSRVCHRDYKIEGSEYTIKAGTKVFIPVYAIHHDPEYYPEPERYDPERFNTIENQKRNPYTFLGFGEGPRNCIGLRFGVLQAKIGLALILKNFKIKKCEKTEIPMNFAKDVLILLSPKGGVHLNIQKIEV